MTHPPPPDTVRADFDRIARVLGETGGPATSDSGLYHDFLLRHVPVPCERALEVGCGTGELARRLAARAGHVLAVDLSPEMIRLARERSVGISNLEFRVADVMAEGLPADAFDCIVSVATLHHLDATAAVRRMRDALRPGGTLILLDLLDRPGVRHLPANAVAFVVRGLRRVRGWRKRAELRRAWRDHGRHDAYPTLGEVRALCAAELPGARVRTHLLWRWSAVWRKPA